MKKFLYPLIDDKFNKNDIDAGINVLKSRQLTMSKITKQFEKKFANFIGSKYAIMVNSGSSANLLAVAALCNPIRKTRAKAGDEVLIPGVSWSTSLWPLVQFGLKPVFVDVNLEDLNMNIDDLLKKINKKTKMIFCVHVLGNSSNMAKIRTICNQKKILLIEDACESLGSTYNGKKLGTFGNIGTYSFFYSKQITSGEGGMIVCKEKKDYQLILSLRSHGWSRNDESHHKKMIKLFPKLEPRFIFSNYGYNLRPLEIQAAIAMEQLKRLKKFEHNRGLNRKKFLELFRDNGNDNKLKFIDAAKNVNCKWYGIPMILNKNLKDKKKKIVSLIEKKGVETRPIVCGNILNQPAIKLFNLNHKKHKLENSQEIEERGFFIGLETKRSSHKTLSFVSNAINKVLSKY